MKQSLTSHLTKLYDIQPEIMLVYHPYRDSTWADRCLFLGEDYDPEKKYNHRSILNNEVVIEFDGKDAQENKRLAQEVCKRLKVDRIEHSLWWSGNRSFHVHFFVDVANAGHLPLLKNVVSRHYTEGLALPDLQLCSQGHLIRAELGVHEKTGELKTIITSTREYPQVCRLPGVVWDKYVKAATTVVKREMTRQVNDLSSLPGFKHVISAVDFRANDDGRERALFMLIHTLKTEYAERKEDLVRFLQEWYRYSGGRQLTDMQVRSKVLSQWSKPYKPGVRYLNELLESLGREDLIAK